MFRKKADLFKKIVTVSGFSTLMDISHAFKRHNVELFLVGGCVRDMLLGGKPHDIDLCTSATPDEIKDILSDIPISYPDYDAGEYYELSPRYGIIETGIKHGTVTVYDNGYCVSVEITTYRVDGKYSDGRHPDEVMFSKSLEEDLRRRDFTVNAIAYDIIYDEVYALDELPFSDIEARTIRAVGNPAERFGEDALRMLRAIRFSAQLGFSIEESTHDAIKSCAHLISKVSKERIRDELTKILMSDNPSAIAFVSTTGLEDHIFEKTSKPSFISDMIKCEQHTKYHYTDVFHHTIDVVRALPKIVYLRWVGFLHDVGKIDKRVTKDGVEHFYGHADVSAEFAKELLTYLKFDNDTIDIASRLIALHDYPWHEVSKLKFKKHLIIVKEQMPALIELMRCDALAHSAECVESLLCNVSRTYERYVGIIENDEPLRLSDLVVDGNDIRELGYEGKEIGEVLSKLLDFVLENADNNRRDRLLNRAKSMKGTL